MISTALTSYSDSNACIAVFPLPGLSICCKIYQSPSLATGLALIIARISLSKEPLSTQILSYRYVDGYSIYTSVSRKILYHIAFILSSSVIVEIKSEFLWFLEGEVRSTDSTIPCLPFNPNPKNITRSLLKLFVVYITFLLVFRSFVCRRWRRRVRER